MDHNKHKYHRLDRRHKRVRKHVIGHPERPRLAVYKSLNHIYAQIIDDLAGRTIASAATNDKSIQLDKTGNATAAAAVGKLIAERAKAAGIEQVTFDRGGFKYHGRIKALADAARECGLRF